MVSRSSIPTALLLGALACAGTDEGQECRADGDLEAEAKVVKCVVADQCVGLEPHPTCPASPDDVVSLCALHGGGFRVSRAACGAGTLLWWSGGTVGFLCLYDERGKLSGTRGATDSPSYCGRHASWTWGAAVPTECFRWSDPNLCMK